jgi:hypothetical protein
MYLCVWGVEFAIFLWDFRTVPTVLVCYALTINKYEKQKIPHSQNKI